MAFHSLIDNDGRSIAQIINDEYESRFDVNPDFQWVDGPVTDEENPHPSDWEYVDGQLQRVVIPPASYDIARRFNYPFPEEQLDMLWHMMDDGVIPGKGSEWYNTIKAVKDANPKPAE